MGIHDLMNRWFKKSEPKRKATRKQPVRPELRFEHLENRNLMTFTIPNFPAAADPITITMPQGQTFWLPLEALSQSGETQTFTVQDTSTTVNTSVVAPNAGRSLRLTVSGRNSSGQNFTGDLTLKLFEDLTPDTTARIIQLVNTNLYDNLTFHRIINNFVAQGGDPAGNGSGGTGVEFSDEFNEALTFSGFGQLAMANSGDDSNDSQFFITDIDIGVGPGKAQTPPVHLNFQHTIFGQLTSGFGTFQQLITTPTQAGDRPTTPVIINDASIFTDNRNGLVRIDAPENFAGMFSVTVTGTTATNVVTQRTFNVNVIADTANHQAFLGDIGDLQTNEDTPIQFTLTGTDLDPDNLTFVVRDAANFSNQPPNVTVTTTSLGSTVDTVAFAQALTAAGVRMFGAWWCPNCEQQRALFGPTGRQFLPYVECSFPETMSTATTDFCIAEGIQAFPTWEFADGSRHEGVLTFEQLSTMSGVPIPRIDAAVQVTITPNANFSGTVNLIVGVTDHASGAQAPMAEFDTERITLTVNSVNDIPTGTAQTINVVRGVPQNITLSGNDGDPTETQTLTFEIVTQPQHGTITGDAAAIAAGMITYTSNADYLGPDSIVFRVRDNGGTDRGGVNVSTNVTITLNVVRELPTAPTNLRLDPESDFGRLNNDAYTSNRRPMLLLNAQPNREVEVRVNGTAAGIATEEKDAPGTYRFTLDNSRLRVGANTITSVSTERFADGTSGGTSVASANFNMVYAPSYSTVYTVPGEVGANQQVRFTFNRSAAFANEIGLFVVDDFEGRIGTIRPEDSTYARAAMNSATRQVIFTTAQTTGQATTLTLRGGSLVGFYLIQNSDRANFLARNPLNNGNGPPAFFSIPAANPDSIVHTQFVADPISGQVQYQWEDMLGGGDRDFNDAVISIALSSDGTTLEPTEAIRVPGAAGQQVPVDFQLAPDAQGNPQVIDGEFGVYVVNNGAGQIGTTNPATSGYAQQAISSTTRRVIFGPGSTSGQQQTINLPSNAMIGFYYIPGGTAQGFLIGNPTNLATGSPRAFFSFDDANTGAEEHFRWYSLENRGRDTDTSEDRPLLLSVFDTLNPTTSRFEPFDVIVDMGS